MPIRLFAIIHDEMNASWASMSELFPAAPGTIHYMLTRINNPQVITAIIQTIAVNMIDNISIFCTNDQAVEILLLAFDIDCCVGVRNPDL